MAYWPQLDNAAVWERQLQFVAVRGSTTVDLSSSVIGGELTQDSRRALRWSGTLQITADSAPVLPSDLLTPFGTRIEATLGIYHPDGTLVQSTPYGHYLISRAAAAVTPGRALVEVTLADIAERIALYKYESPIQIPAGIDLADVADFVFNSRLGQPSGLAPTGILTDRVAVHGLTTTADPWKELTDLFAAYGLLLYYRGDGTVTATPVPTAGAGQPIGMTNMTVAFEHRPANVIVARGEQSDPTIPPVQVVVMDDDPGSPTYAGPSPGSTPYGRITDYVDSPMIIDTTIATNAATAKLAERVGADVDLERPFDPATSPGDTLLVGNPPSKVLVDAATVSVTGPTSITGRLVD